jgi:hypothetical protein
MSTGLAIAMIGFLRITMVPERVECQCCKKVGG